MPRLRIGTTVASCLVIFAAAVAGAAAQTATTGAPGKPLPLLQLVHPKSKAKLRAHPRIAAKFAKKARLKRRIAKRMPAKRHKAVVEASRAPTTAPAPVPAATAATAKPENIWPAVNGATPDTGPGGMAALAPRSAPAVATEPVIDTEPDAIMGTSHIVQPATPDDVLAAGNQQPATKTAPPANPVAAQIATADRAAPKPARVMMVKPAAQSDPSPVGSASWIAHVLAALGGAITAGAVAWFLIGPAPRRTYG